MIPADLDAERALITAMLLDDTHELFPSISPMLEPEMFYKPAHQHVWSSMEQISPATNDLVLLAARLKANGHEGEEYTLNGMVRYFCDPTIPTTTISHAPRYARAIHDAAANRGIIMALSESAEKLQSGIDATTTRDSLISKLQDISTIEEVREPPNALEFADAVNYDHDWVIPDFLDRGNRLMITGSEGSGKSTLITQIAFMASAGLHPWTYRPFAPVKVLLVDLENGDAMVARRVRTMQAAIISSKRDLPEPWNPNRMRIQARSEGIDLMKGTDRDWLASACLGAQADLLVIGPVYRMVSGTPAKNDMGGEDQARQITAAIDQVRQRCGDLPVILEGHAPKGSESGQRNLTPFGSSVWMRWNFFGLGLRPIIGDDPNAYEFTKWREDRDERVWPKILYKHSKPWPWVANMG